ncbi:hypothetical protein V6N12_050693 [Hibiscus sabdariffa]|uniref:Endonuclease/exonuclease/phosphatase n=1 Tax=Hibiscus sabdariffa TaxID=183260 RepID=A0ABR2GDJ4_9ROSI
MSPSFENPSSHAYHAPNENPGGRPREHIPSIPGDVTRERSLSPSRLDSEHVTKKTMGENSDMDTSIESPIVVDILASPNQDGMESKSPTLNPSTIQKASYENVVLEGNQSTPADASTQFADPEVVVMQDDIILNPDAKIPSIQFSDRVHDQEDCELSKAIENCPRSTSAGNTNVHVPKAPENSESNLFVPWMKGEALEAVADERRTVAQNAIPIVSSQQEHDDNLKSSIGRSTHQNEVYLAFNPDKKNRASKQSSVNVEVVPLSKDWGARVVHHNSDVPTGSHTAITIVESGDDGSAITTGKDGSGKSSRKGIVVARGLKVRTAPQIRGNGGMSPNDLIRHISAHADTATHSGNGILGVTNDSSRSQNSHGSALQLNNNQNLELLDVPVKEIETQVQLVPWVLGGDFNTILSPDERIGAVAHCASGNKKFDEFISNMGLTNLGLRGSPFTWNRGSLHQRLDRCFGNGQWCMSFLEATVTHLDRLGSDHHPLLVSLTDDDRNRGLIHFVLLMLGNLTQTFRNFLKHQG